MCSGIPCSPPRQRLPYRRHVTMCPFQRWLSSWTQFQYVCVWRASRIIPSNSRTPAECLRTQIWDYLWMKTKYVFLINHNILPCLTQTPKEVLEFGLVTTNSKWKYTRTLLSTFRSLCLQGNWKNHPKSDSISLLWTVGVKTLLFWGKMSWVIPNWSPSEGITPVITELLYCSRGPASLVSRGLAFSQKGGQFNLL